MLKRFDQDSETPELIWNGAMRGELRAALAKQLDSFVKGRSEPDEKTTAFQLPPMQGQNTRISKENYTSAGFM